MSGPDPHHLLAKAAAKASVKSPNAAVRKRQATELAKIFEAVGMHLAAENLKKAKEVSYQAQEMLDVLDALYLQDTYPELHDEKCEEKRQALRVWRDLLKPSAELRQQLEKEYGGRHMHFIADSPRPKYEPPVKKRNSYQGGIFETAFVPDDARKAVKFGFPEKLVFRHGVKDFRGYVLSVYDAVNRKAPAFENSPTSLSTRTVFEDNGRGWTDVIITLRMKSRHREEAGYEMLYRIGWTNHEQGAEMLAELRGEEKPKSAAKKATRRKA